MRRILSTWESHSVIFKNPGKRWKVRKCCCGWMVCSQHYTSSHSGNHAGFISLASQASIRGDRTCGGMEGMECLVLPSNRTVWANGLVFVGLCFWQWKYTVRIICAFAVETVCRCVLCEPFLQPDAKTFQSNSLRRLKQNNNYKRKKIKSKSWQGNGLINISGPLNSNVSPSFKKASFKC